MGIVRIVCVPGLIYFMIMFAANLTSVIFYIVSGLSPELLNNAVLTPSGIQTLPVSQCGCAFRWFLTSNVRLARSEGYQRELRRHVSQASYSPRILSAQRFPPRINCIMTARLILNLKSANNQPNAPKHHYGYDGTQTAWEANIIGNLGNEFEGNSTGFSSTTESFNSANFKGKRRRSEAEEMMAPDPRQPLQSYELDERPGYIQGPVYGHGAQYSGEYRPDVRPDGW